MEKKTLGSFLSALRRAKGLTQQEVADRLLVSNRAVSRWERDEAAPDISLLPAIADLFGVTVDELLRGERRRSPVDPPASAESASDEATTESTDAARTPPSDPRALRGARALCRRETTRFRTMLLIAAALVVAGYICLLGITYGLERVYIGFAVFALFCVGSVVLSVIAATRLADVLREQNPNMGDPVLHLPAEDRGQLLAAYVRGCFVAIVAPVAGMVLALPLVLYKKHSYVGERFMLDAKDYLLVAVLLAAALVVAGLLLFSVFREWMWGKWAEVLEIPAAKKTIRPRMEALRQLNRRQWITAVGGCGGGLLAEMLVMAFTTPDTYNAWYTYVGEILSRLLVLAGVALPMVTLVRFVRREGKSDRVVKANLLISGVRNIVISLAGSWFWTAGITYVSSGSNDVYAPEFLWNLHMMFAWAIGTVALFGIAEIVRHFAAKRK